MKHVLKIVLFFLFLCSIIAIFNSDSIVEIALFQWSMELPIAAVMCFTLSAGISIGIILPNMKA